MDDAHECNCMASQRYPASVVRCNLLLIDRVLTLLWPTLKSALFLTPQKKAALGAKRRHPWCHTTIFYAIYMYLSSQKMRMGVPAGFWLR